MKWRSFVALSGVVFLVAIAVSCGSAKVGPGGYCEKDGDCADGLICKDNTCSTASSECRPPCQPNESCVNGTCVPAGDPNDKDGDGFQVPPLGNDCNDFDPTVNPGAHEYCDGVDNDCDGTTDEDCPPCVNASTQDCGTDVGECTRGVQLCSAGVWEACNGTGPQPELCDGKDNDCDGLVDEICSCNNGDSLACGVDEGQCRMGTQTCEAGAWSGCRDGQVPVAETCDGLDNDCDGMIDDGFALHTPCTGLGQCGEGTIECAGEYDIRCSTMPGGSQDQSGAEVCDGVDNDCNGVADEGMETDQAPNTCTLAEDKGAIPDDGSSIVITGNLWPEGDEDWYKILAKDDVNEYVADGCDAFRLQIRFLNNPGGRMLIDVYAESCAQPTDLCTDDTEYEHSYAGHFHDNPNTPGMGQCPCSPTNSGGMTICSEESKTFYIRVHAPSGQAGSCDNYQLSVTNGVP